MKCVVTGGCGFIGSHLVDALIARQVEVVVIDDMATGNAANLHEDACLAAGSVLDLDLLRSTLKGADCVFHLAAWARVQRSIDDPIGTHNVNVLGTLNVLDAALKSDVPRLVYISSSSVYGDQPTHLMREDMTPNPMSPYALQKLIGEQYCTMYARLFGLTIASLRYFNVYGPRQAAEGPYTMVMGRFQQQRDAGEPMTVYGDGEQTRAYTYVGDAVNATVLAGTRDLPAGENVILNVGTKEETSVMEIARLMGGEVRNIYPNPRGAFEERRKAADCSKAKAVLGWEPAVPIREGFAMTYPPR